MNGPKSASLPIAVTMGDPAGVGPLLVALARAQEKSRHIPGFVFLGDGTSAAPGVPDTANAKAIIKSIEDAVRMAVNGKARAVVTNPIHKKSLMDSGFKHKGHTGFLGELTGATPVMMLANDELKVVPVTGHVALKDAIKLITVERIVETAEIVARDLEGRFGIHKPRMAFTGLNPHAGEEGALGNEEIKTIIPAIKMLQAKGYQAQGPFPADSAYTAAMRMKFDVFLAMTHDQALTPVKTLDYRKTVNITLGLPIVRTSPAHGTAFDLVKAGDAPDPESFIQALLWAERLSQ